MVLAITIIGTPGAIDSGFHSELSGMIQIIVCVIIIALIALKWRYQNERKNQ